jgi:hypothetical protein
MERDNFIIMVFCLVSEFYHQLFAQPLRKRGFPPALSDEEVITMDICGEYFGYNKDEDLFDYFSDHYRHFFPKLSERTGFIRQSANLAPIKMQIQHHITQISGQAGDDCQIIDTLPLPVCTFTRAPRDRCFKPVADYGYCAAKQMKYYGFKLGLRISRLGMITHFPLLPARPHDSQLLDDLIEGYEGIVIGDKAFIDGWRQEQLAKRRHVALVTGSRKNMTQQLPQHLRKISKRWRKRVETVGSHLTERFHIAKTRARDLYHYQHRLIRKVLAHTVCVFINLQLGRSPLDLDDLVISKVAH